MSILRPWVSLANIFWAVNYQVDSFSLFQVWRVLSEECQKNVLIVIFVNYVLGKIKVTHWMYHSFAKCWGDGAFIVLSWFLISSVSFCFLVYVKKERKYKDHIRETSTPHEYENYTPLAVFNSLSCGNIWKLVIKYVKDMFSLSIFQFTFMLHHDLKVIVRYTIIFENF